MNVGEALSLAGKSMKLFEDKIYEMKLKELYELTDNLRFVNRNNVDAFETAYEILMDRLVKWYEHMKKEEKDQPKKDSKGANPIFAFWYVNAFDITGFDNFNSQSPEFNPSIPPSEIFKNYIERISKWKK